MWSTRSYITIKVHFCTTYVSTKATIVYLKALFAVVSWNAHYSCHILMLAMNKFHTTCQQKQFCFFRYNDYDALRLLYANCQTKTATSHITKYILSHISSYDSCIFAVCVIHLYGLDVHLTESHIICSRLICISKCSDILCLIMVYFQEWMKLAKFVSIHFLSF